jgi:GDP-4-dehydro-6-deoxy-D-mannose reductase
VVPSFARQLAAAGASGARMPLFVGNLEPVRDFSHVKDVVAAYGLLLERGVSGEVYNVCSGHARSIRSVLDEMIEASGAQVDVSVDPSKLRPADIPYLVGRADKIRQLGWTPTLTLRQALEDVLAEARARFTAAG